MNDRENKTYYCLIQAVEESSQRGPMRREKRLSSIRGVAPKGLHFQESIKDCPTLSHLLATGAEIMGAQIVPGLSPVTVYTLRVPIEPEVVQHIWDPYKTTVLVRWQYMAMSHWTCDTEHGGRKATFDLNSPDSERYEPGPGLDATDAEIEAAVRAEWAGVNASKDFPEELDIRIRRPEED